MSIQLKTSFPDSINRASVLNIYKNTLQNAVRTFSKKEEAFILTAIQNIFKQSKFDLNKVIDAPIALIKTAGNLYGDGVYFTREHSIVIPEDELDRPIQQDFEEVMIHELFHIYSRYHPEKRKALYELIGFKSIGITENIQMNPALKKRLLLNPDGINYAYAIELEEQGNRFQAIPLIISNKEEFDPEEKVFFNYLQFDLYKIQPPYSRLIKVEANNDGTSLIDFNEFSSFRKQIGDNTDYIIHPDEVLADNFILLLSGEDSWGNLSPRGQEILKGMKEIIFE